MKRLLNKSLITVAALGLATGLSGCGTLHNISANKNDKIAAHRVCDKLKEPPREPLANITFFPLPPGTTVPGGVELVAGLTADGVADTIGNTAKLRKRESKWQGRMDAVNTCLDDAAKDSVAKK